MNIELRPEIIMSVFGFPVTNTFLTTVLVTVILFLVSVVFYFKGQNSRNFVLSGFRILVFGLLKLTDEVSRDRKITRQILPLIATFFLFIVTANLLALIPGFLGSFFVKTSSGDLPLLRSPNSDLNTTVALALFSVLATQYFSIRILGFRKFLRRFVNFTGPIKFVLGFFEIISEAVRLLSFSFRLFGNVFAGEVLILVIAFLVPFFVPIPFMILEMFVAIIQAFIFAVLTLTFIESGIVQAQG